MDGPGPPFCLGAPPALRPPRLGRQSGTRCGPLPPRAPNTALRQAPGLPGAGPRFLPLPCSPAGAGGSGGGGLAARSAPRWLDSEGALPTRAPAGAPALEGLGRGRGQDGAPQSPSPHGRKSPLCSLTSDPCFLRHVLPLAPDSSVAPLLSSRLLPAPRPRNLERALGAGQDTSAHALSSSSSAGGAGISHLGGRGRGDAERRCNWPAATQLARAGLGFGAQQDAARAEPLAQR